MEVEADGPQLSRRKSGPAGLQPDRFCVLTVSHTPSEQGLCIVHALPNCVVAHRSLPVCSDTSAPKADKGAYMDMGPANRYAAISHRVSYHAHGLRRTCVLYPDGIEIECRVETPFEAVRIGCVMGLMPRAAYLVHLATDGEQDGRTYLYGCYWLPDASAWSEVIAVGETGVTCCTCKSAAV